MNLYRQLFELTKENMEAADMTLNCDAESFCASVNVAPVSIDLKEAEKLSGKEYIQALWFSFFQKLPSKDLLTQLEGMTKAQILQKAVNEPAYGIRQIRLENPPYPIKIHFKSRVYRKISAVKQSVLLRKIAKALPKGLQNKIRGMFT